MTKEIYVVGYPKSGNTWLSQLIADALDSPFKGKFHAVPIGTEGLDRPGEYLIRQLHLRPVYDIDHDEAVPDAYTYSMNQRGAEKVIHIMRDPRDVAVSVYYYWEKPTVLGAIRSCSGLNEGEGNASPLGGMSWQEYVEAWLAVEGVIQTSYEVLHANTLLELKWILEQMEAEPVNNLAEVVGRQSLENKKVRLEKEPEKARPYHRGIQRKNLRKGIVGDWRNHFGKEEKTLAHQAWWDMMSRLGYEANERWWR